MNHMKRYFHVFGYVDTCANGNMDACVRGRQILEAELTMTMKINVISMVDPKQHFSEAGDPCRSL